MDDVEYTRAKNRTKAEPRTAADREEQDPGRRPWEDRSPLKKDEA